MHCMVYYVQAVVERKVWTGGKTVAPATTTSMEMIYDNA